MPNTPTHYPKLANLIDARAIPGDMQGLENIANQGIDFLLGNLRYKDYMVESSSDNDTIFYSLVILTKALRKSLSKDGMEIVFFDGTTPGHTGFPIAFEWQWAIQKYIAEFEAQGFSYLPDAFLDILLAFADIEDEQAFVEEVIRVFLVEGTAPYENFFTEITTTYQNLKNDWPQVQTDIQTILTEIGTIKNEVDRERDNGKKLIQIAKNYEDNPVLKDAVEKITTAVKTIEETADVDIDVYRTVIQAVLADIQDIDEKFDQLFMLFRAWLGNIQRTDIEDLLIPQFAIELQEIKMALEFPRKWLIPLDADDQPMAGKSALTFTAGVLRYSTQTGFEFDNQSNFDFPYSAIGKTGFTLNVTDFKVDLSKKRNIPEADAEGRPVEFIGMYCRDATIGLPKKWFKQKNDQTLAIYGRNLLIGTGGLSGRIGLEAKSTLRRQRRADNELEFVLGKKEDGNPDRKGFVIGFKKFEMEWYQGSLIKNEVEGSLTIPNFKRYNKASGNSINGPLKINIEALFEQDGDFQITAMPEEGLCICIGKDGKVFFIEIQSLSVGKNEDQVYVEVSGNLDFSNNKLLNKYLEAPITIQKLRIYRDGSFEIEGGSIPIPTSQTMQLGPVEVNVTNITLGSETIEEAAYKFIGFDCGVSTGAGGLDMRGDGIKIYFNHDGSKMFLRIAGIGIDLTIPGTASEETAALILKGYLSLKKEEYVGSVAFTLPKAKISGGAAMKMKPKVPAFAVDGFMEMSTAIPLGPTGLGIYGFRGLFGLRYVANLPDGALQEPDKMFDFYSEKKGDPLNSNTPTKGLHLGKIISPDDVNANPNSGTPISIGAGISLGTTADSGRAFSMMAFLFISIPDFLMISGKANVMSERVGVTEEEEPPFFAYLALTRDYISLGMGADYTMPKEKERPGNGGDILELFAQAQLAFYFKDPSAWYIHFGTKEHPVRAKLIKKVFSLNAYAYLMLSANGIQTGAGIGFNKDKKYGPASVAIRAYVDVYGELSFRKVQVGGGVALGGSVDVSVFGVGFYISLDAYLMMTVPKPFIISGGVEICVKVKLLFVKFEKCLNVEFKWEFNKDKDLTPIGLIATEYNPVSGYHIGSGLPYELDPPVSDLSTLNIVSLKKIPLDTYIDIQFKKAVNPNAATQIGGVTNAPVNNWEKVSPKSIQGQVIHEFRVESVEILVKNGNIWTPYHPYKALDSTSFLDTVNPDELKIGYWQKKGKEYNNLRILSTNPFSYMDSMAGQIIPEQMGLTAATLFCPSKAIEQHCIRWRTQKTFKVNKWTAHENVLFKVSKKNGMVIPFSNVFNIPSSLKIHNSATLEIIFPERVQQCELKLFSFSDKVVVKFYDWDSPLPIPAIASKTKRTTKTKRATTKTLKTKHTTTIKVKKSTPTELVHTPIYQLVETQIIQKNDFVIPVNYQNETKSIKKIVIEIPCATAGTIATAQNEVVKLQRQQWEGKKKNARGQSIAKLLNVRSKKLKALQKQCCPDLNIEGRLAAIEKGLKALLIKLRTLKSKIVTAQQKETQSCQQYEDLLIFKNNCFNQQINYPPTIRPCKKKRTKEQDYEAYKNALTQLQKEQEKCTQDIQQKFQAIQIKLEKELQILKSICDDSKITLSALEKEYITCISRLEGLQKLKKELEKLKEIDTCSTYIHELCYLTEEEVLYNLSIPSKAAVEGDYSAMLESNNKVIAPTWRPDEVYAIKVGVSEIINGTPSTPTPKIWYFPFATEGPIGHFSLKNLNNTLKDQYELDLNGLPNKLDRHGLPKPQPADFDTRIEIPENALKFYLDMARSYPNPSGNILNQKLMYYSQPSIKLFFNQPFVKHFFSNWPTYDGLPERDAQLAIIIKDPTENATEIVNTSDGPNQQVLGPNDLPSTTINWIKDENPMLSKPLELLNDLRNPKRKNVNFNGQTCWQVGGEVIKPATKQPNVKVKKLLPSKLYNVVIYNDYSKDMITYERKLVHSFPFQTSRYADLANHINSYKLTTEAGDIKPAIYDLEMPSGKTLKGLLQIGLAMDEYFSNDIDQKLVTTYVDGYQRIVDGYLAYETIPAAVSTEFNLIKNANGNILGLWVRTLEPLNDPRIPYPAMFESIKVLINGQEKNMLLRDIDYLGISGSSFTQINQVLDTIIAQSAFISFMTVYSSDRSSAFIIPTAPINDSQELNLQFSYLEWDGNNYVEQASFTTENLL